MINKSKYIFILFCFLPKFAFANLDLITWKGIYYDPIPNQKNISQAFCEAHNPGSFIHVVKDALAHPVYTDRGIKLDRAKFYMEQKHGVYLIHGDFWASGKSNGKSWQDHIYFYLTKLSEAGIGHGVWSSDKCKGYYLGVAVKDNNLKIKT